MDRDLAVTLPVVHIAIHHHQHIAGQKIAIHWIHRAEIIMMSVNIVMDREIVETRLAILTLIILKEPIVRATARFVMVLAIAPAIRLTTLLAEPLTAMAWILAVGIIMI